MKKAFTFAELMISLVLISVLSAILYPTILQFTPNTNKPLFKSAYRTLSNAIAVVTNDTIDGKIAHSTSTTTPTGETLCQIFCNKMNVVPESDTTANNTCTNMCNDNTITTTNGMKWYFYPYLEAGYTGAGYNEGTIANTFKIVVDVNSSNNNLDSAGGVITGLPFATGVFYYTPDKTATGIFDIAPGATHSGVTYPDGEFISSNLKSQDTFEILVNLDGEIVSMSPAAWANLEDNETTDQ